MKRFALAVVVSSILTASLGFWYARLHDSFLAIVLSLVNLEIAALAAFMLLLIRKEPR